MDIFESGFFQGTIFRFPLRDLKSELSENIYSREKIENLFESFRSEANNILIFLNHVTSITLNTKDSIFEDPVESFKVQSEITFGHKCKEEFLFALKSHAEVVINGETKTLTLKNDSKVATWSLKIKLQDDGIITGKEKTSEAT